MLGSPAAFVAAINRPKLIGRNNWQPRCIGIGYGFVVVGTTYAQDSRTHSSNARHNSCVGAFFYTGWILWRLDFLAVAGFGRSVDRLTFLLVALCGSLAYIGAKWESFSFEAQLSPLFFT